MSPFPFVIVMTVLTHDAITMFGARDAYDRGDLADLVYADDTLLMGATTSHLPEFLQAKVSRYMENSPFLSPLLTFQIGPSLFRLLTVSVPLPSS